jgi:hypothetical protein
VSFCLKLFNLTGTLRRKANSHIRKDVQVYICGLIAEIPFSFLFFSRSFMELGVIYTKIDQMVFMQRQMQWLISSQ